MVDLNFHSKDVSHASTSATTALQSQLQLLNSRWDRCCARAALWQKELQISLLQGSELTNSLTGLAQWLLQADNQIYSLASSKESNSEKTLKLRVKH